MSDIKLFQIGQGGVQELVGQSMAVEKSLQTLIEQNLEAFLGVRFLDSEYWTGKIHGGRIDTLGLDENACPVIIEYKRGLNQNVINQGLFYLDWLLDHQDAFTQLAVRVLGQIEADKVDWSEPRLVCIAGDFTKYDEYAVRQIDRNIDLMRYKKYGSDHLVLELANAKTAANKSNGGVTSKATTASVTKGQVSTVLTDRFEALRATLLAFGGDVQENVLKHYTAFKRIKNFACVEMLPGAEVLCVYVKVNPDTVSLENGFMRDVRRIGHSGTGDLEIRIASDADLKKAEPLFIKSYEAS